MPSSWPRGRLRHFSALRPSSDGSHLSLIHIRRSRRNAVALMGISLADALIMASRTPAAFLGLESELGRIAPGYRADLVVFSPGFDVIGTWIGGAGSICEAPHRG